MNSVSRLTPGALVYRTSHYGHDRLADWELINQTVLQDFTDSNIELTSLKTNCLILDFCVEGHDDRDIKLVVEYFQQYMPLKQIRVLFNSCVNVHQLPYQAACWPTHLADHMQFFSKLDTTPLPVIKKFLCLNRRPSLIRAEFLSSLLDSVDNQNIVCTFGSSGDPVSQYQSLFSAHQLPLLVDGIKNCNNNDHHQIPPIFKQCLFNIITETSVQGGTNNWQSVLITEKTFKALALRQIPIWFAVPGVVQQVRILGFDLFDDIVDHSYDRIQDQQQRLQAVLQQINHLDSKWATDQLSQLQQSLTSRLENNYNRLRMFTADHSQIYQNFLLDLSRS
jgi:hypothetical protein